MAPQRLSNSASVRYKTRHVARVPFRDDTSLLAFRYEETVQAKPPIPIPPRNPARTSRPVSFVSTVVVPSPLVPPKEQHPALRPRRPSFDDWKRDSGLAPTTSSSTIVEEDPDCEEATAFFFKLLPDEPTSPSPSGRQSLTIGDLEGQGGDGNQDNYNNNNYKDDDDSSVAAAAAAAEEFLRRSQSREHPFHAIFESPRPPPTPKSPSSFAIHPFAGRISFERPRQTPNKMTRAASLGQDGARPNKLKKKASVSARSEPPPSPQNLPKSFVVGPASPPLPLIPLTDDNHHRDGSPPWSGRLEDPCHIGPTFRRDNHSLEFAPITTAIPTDKLIEEEFLDKLTFSSRGSVMFGGRRAIGKSKPATEMHPSAAPAIAVAAATRSDPTATQTRGPSRLQATKAATQVPSFRVLPLEVERESQKVRSLYEPDKGDDDWEDGGLGSSSSQCDGLEPAAVDASSSGEPENVADAPRHSSVNHSAHRHPADTPQGIHSSPRPDSFIKGEYELAGGIEDWEDVDGAYVDRYGFILQSPRRVESRSNSTDARPLHSSHSTPRRRNVLTKRLDSPASGASLLSPGRTPSRKVSARSLDTQASEVSVYSRRSVRSSVRAAANLLPHNRDRRLTDEAGDMLVLAPGTPEAGGGDDDDKDEVSEAHKKKEWERAEKWRKMAKITRKGQSGQGMEFEFDAKNPKVINRTWKGIPDRWRAAAWYSFLGSSSRKHGFQATEEELVAEFQRLQYVASSDDMQIDLDVPRTINRHIMFRRRYRGGQRLLFRVLHALSLYFPETGYVQGMASLAATLLCYFDEEKAFIMLVWMWRYRGLERLYQPGFGSLMAALKDFEREWLDGKDVSRKLAELCIDPTAYATRWYLTLFNLSIPFPAQLRVWDVFMLLGEPSPIPPPDAPPDATVPGLDVLHATSAALMDALAEVLMDSDFENAMRALTSWIPVKDEDLLMKVTRAEWKQHQGKKKT